MKKQAFGILTMFGLLLVVTAVSVHAQSKRSIINIPFNFNVGQKTLPAGEYTVEPLRKDSQTVWLVENRSQHASVLFTTTSVWTSETKEETKLVFNRYGDQSFLSQIWTAGDNSGRELPRRRSELQLAKNGIQPEKVVVTLAAGE
ncbi:MAG TPA: hypothetical protein VGJ66_13415 [Pyrinomonadaceae bacterium]|jgi:hypothetical protein